MAAFDPPVDVPPPPDAPARRDPADTRLADWARGALRERHGVRLATAAPDTDAAAPAFHAPLTIHPALSPS
mgnify:CR=1 FL=1